MKLALLDELLGNFEPQKFIIIKPDGEEGAIKVKPLTIDEIHEAVILTQKLMRNEKKTDDETRLQYQNYFIILKSLVEPKMSLEQIRKLPVGVYTQLVDIVHKTTIINPFDKKK